MLHDLQSVLCPRSTLTSNQKQINARLSEPKPKNSHHACFQQNKSNAGRCERAHDPFTRIAYIWAAVSELKRLNKHSSPWRFRRIAASNVREAKTTSFCFSKLSSLCGKPHNFVRSSARNYVTNKLTLNKNDPIYGSWLPDKIIHDPAIRRTATNQKRYRENAKRKPPHLQPQHIITRRTAISASPRSHISPFQRQLHVPAPSEVFSQPLKIGLFCNKLFGHFSAKEREKQQKAM